MIKVEGTIKVTIGDRQGVELTYDEAQDLCDQLTKILGRGNSGYPIPMPAFNPLWYRYSSSDPYPEGSLRPSVNVTV